MSIRQPEKISVIWNGLLRSLHESSRNIAPIYLTYLIFQNTTVQKIILIDLLNQAIIPLYQNIKKNLKITKSNLTKNNKAKVKKNTVFINKSKNFRGVWSMKFQIRCSKFILIFRTNQMTHQTLYNIYNAQQCYLSVNNLSLDCFAPYLYFFNFPSQYMNPNSFCQDDIFCNQTPAQHVQNVFPPTANEFVPSFQKKNEKSNEATQTPQKGIENNENENRQKFGRNIVSNIFHLMIKFVRRSKKIREMIIKIIKKYGMTVKINEFHHIFKKMAGKVSPYATDYQMKEIWLGSEKNQNPQGIKAQKEQQCCKIFRILGRIYLERYHLAYVYNSNKIKKESKKLHRSCIRKIYMI